MFRGTKSKDPWVMVKGGINLGDGYTDGFEVVGDISRRREKKSEVSTKDFLTTVTPTHFPGNFMPPLDSTSLRTHKSVDFFSKTNTHSDKLYPKTFQAMLSTKCNTEDSEQQLSPLLNSNK